jgi:hypothetical protein
MVELIITTENKNNQDRRVPSRNETHRRLIKRTPSVRFASSTSTLQKHNNLRTTNNQNNHDRRVPSRNETHRHLIKRTLSVRFASSTSTLQKHNKPAHHKQSKQPRTVFNQTSNFLLRALRHLYHWQATYKKPVQ